MSKSTDERRDVPATASSARRRRTPPRHGATVTAATVLAAGVGWAIGRGLLGHAPVARSAQIGALQVVAVTVVVALAAWLTSALAARRGPDGRRAWLSAAAGVALLSLLGPITEARGGSTAVLLGLHAGVAAVLLLGFGRWRR